MGNNQNIGDICQAPADDVGYLGTVKNNTPKTLVIAAVEVD